MTRYILGSCAALSLLFLTSCGEQTVTKQSTSTSSKTGIIRHVDVDKEDQNGKLHPTEYMFLSDDVTEESLYLKSSTVNLDKYIDDEVTIEGTFEDIKNRIFLVRSVDENVVKKNAEYTDGFSYRNDDMGIEFFYPATWKMEEKSEERLVGTLLEGDEVFAISVAKEPTVTFDAWLKKAYPKDTFSDVTVGQVVAKSMNNPKGVSEMLFLSVNGMFYTMKFSYAKGDITVDKDYAAMKSSMQFFVPKKESDGTVDSKATKVEGANSSSSTSEEKKMLEDSTTTEEKTTEEKTTPASTSSSESSASNQSIVSYVSKQASSLPGEGTKSISQIEVADGGYVYVTYTVGDKENKVLYSYSDKNGSISLSQVGLFEKGEKEDWVKLSGENKAKNAARDVYAVSTSGSAEKKTTVSAGKSLYTNKNLSFEAEYPRSWYYSGENISSSGGITKVTFSNKPLDESPDAKVELSVYGSGQVNLSGAEKTTIGGKEAYLLMQDGVAKYAIKGADGKVYVTTTTEGAASKAALEDIVKTLKTK